MLARRAARVLIARVPAPDPLLAAALAAAVALAGWGARALGAGGAAAAGLVGTAILSRAGWAGGAALLAFFVAGSAISRVLDDGAGELDPKGDRRDAWQVLANGGAAAAGAWLAPGAEAAGWIVTASLAAAGADTWATSWGAGSGRPPRHVLTGRVVPRGASGGITARGTLGGVAGGALVAAAGALVLRDDRLAAAGAVIGAAGMLLDSVLGTAQGRYRCPACEVPSERRRHRCGTRTAHLGGWTWLTNDGVNLAATAAAAAGGWLAWRWWSP